MRLTAFVLAGTHRQFDLFVRSSGGHPKDFRYVSDFHRIAGAEDAVLLLTGTYYEHPDYVRVVEYCRAKGVPVLIASPVFP